MLIVVVPSGHMQAADADTGAPLAWPGGDRHRAIRGHRRLEKMTRRWVVADNVGEFPGTGTDARYGRNRIALQVSCAHSVALSLCVSCDEIPRSSGDGYNRGWKEGCK